MKTRKPKAKATQKPAITAEQAVQLEQATLKNIVEKIGAGGIPTAREMGILKGATQKPEAQENKRISGQESDTLAAAASRLGCTSADLKRAKAAGCDGFTHGRVKLDKVKKWLQANPPTEDDLSEEALKKRKLLAQCKKLELDEAILRGEFTGNAMVTQIAVAWSAQVRAEFMLLLSETPTWQGLDAPSLQDRARTFVNGALGRLTTFSAPCTPAS